MPPNSLGMHLGGCAQHSLCCVVTPLLLVNGQLRRLPHCHGYVFYIIYNDFKVKLTLSFILTVLHPRHKLQYFETTSWERDWIVTAEEIVRDEYKGSYSDIEVEIPGMDSDEQEINTTSKKKVYPKLPTTLLCFC